MGNARCFSAMGAKRAQRKRGLASAAQMITQGLKTGFRDFIAFSPVIARAQGLRHVSPA